MFSLWAMAMSLLYSGGHWSKARHLNWRSPVFTYCHEQGVAKIWANRWLWYRTSNLNRLLIYKCALAVLIPTIIMILIITILLWIIYLFFRTTSLPHRSPSPPGLLKSGAQWGGRDKGGGWERQWSSCHSDSSGFEPLALCMADALQSSSLVPRLCPQKHTVQIFPTCHSMYD